jgi:hypothetical protein
VNATAKATPLAHEQGPRRIGASIGAVIAGFATAFFLSMAIDAGFHAAGIYPPYGVRMSNALFVLAIGYRGLVTIAGGWVTARLAPSAPLRHAVILAAVGTLAGSGGVALSLAHPELGPLWYPVVLVAMAWPCIWAGAWLSLSGAGPRRRPPPTAARWPPTRVGPADRE